MPVLDTRMTDAFSKGMREMSVGLLGDTVGGVFGDVVFGGGGEGMVDPGLGGPLGVFGKGFDRVAKGILDKGRRLRDAARSGPGVQEEMAKRFRAPIRVVVDPGISVDSSRLQTMFNDAVMFVEKETGQTIDRSRLNIRVHDPDNFKAGTDLLGEKNLDAHIWFPEKGGRAQIRFNKNFVDDDLVAREGMAHELVEFLVHNKQLAPDNTEALATRIGGAFAGRERIWAFE